MTVFDLATYVVGYHLLGGAMFVLYLFGSAVRRESDAETHDLAGLYRPSEYTLPRGEYRVVADEPLPAPAAPALPPAPVDVPTAPAAVPAAPVVAGPPIPPGEDPLSYYLAPWEVEDEPAPLAGDQPTCDLESFTDTWIGADTRRRALIPPADLLAELIAKVEATRDPDADTTVDTTAIRAEAA